MPKLVVKPSDPNIIKVAAKEQKVKSEVGSMTSENDRLALKKHAEGVIRAFAENRHEVRWAITEIVHDLDRGLTKPTLLALIREMTYGRKYEEWRRGSNVNISRLKQLEEAFRADKS